MLKSASAIQFYILIAMTVIGHLVFIFLGDIDWLFTSLASLLVGSLGLIGLPLFLLGCIALFFRGSNNPIQYVFAQLRLH